MISDLKKKIFSTEEFSKLSTTKTMVSAPVILRGVSGSLWAFIAAYLFEEYQGQILLLVPEKDTAEKMRDDCAQLLSNANVRLYAKEPIHAGQALDMTATISQVETLKALSAKLPGIYITHASALAFSVPPKEEFTKSIIELSANSATSFEGLLSTLAARGFERKLLVETYGDFAVRGGIVDIFPFIGENPVRLEFWGDTVESIREFDVLSQRSIRELQTVSIVPDLSAMQNDLNPKVSLVDFFSPDMILLADDPQLIKKEIQELESEGIDIDFSFGQISEIIGKFPSYIHSVVSKSSAGPGIEFHSSPQPPTNGSVKILLEQIKKLSGANQDIIIASDTEEESQRIRELIEETATQEEDSTQIEAEREFVSESDIESEPPHSDLLTIGYIPETFHSGFVYPSARIALFTEHEIFGRLKRRGTAKHRRFKGISPKELHALQYGDYVVHIDHGIGKFLGLEKISLQGTEQEVAKIEYDEKGVLFVNLNYVNRIQKYSSAEGHTPKLNKLGGGEWEKLKARAKKKMFGSTRIGVCALQNRPRESAVNSRPSRNVPRISSN